MRETVLAKGELDTIVIVTTNTGTTVLDGEDEVLEAHPDDQHAAILARYLALGWEVEEDGP
jgi:hypothetical protein